MKTNTEYIINKIKNEERIICTPKGTFIGNQRCHINSLSFARLNSKDVDSIVGGIQVFNNTVCAHFIVKMKDGTYIDPTYGNMVDQYNGFIPIIIYTSISTFKLNSALQTMKEYVYNMLPWYRKLFSSVENC